MKQVTIIYRNCNNPNAINFIKNNLEEVFGEYIAFSNCYLCDVKPEEKLKADAFLALGEDIFQRVKESGYVDDFSKIIKMNRSPDRIALNKISEIPLNTNVLIVNDSYESSLDTTYSFYEAGIGHINMIPYDSALEHTGIYDKIEIAITPAEAHLVPVQIKEIIDIGYRKVSFDTMFKLMKMLDLDIGIINRNLFRHIHSVVESNTAFHANYVYGYLKSEMLSHMASSSKIGMILVDQFFQIVYANDKAIQIFQEDDKNKIQIEKYIDPAILSSDDAQNMPINILDSNYYYDRFAITLMDEIAGYYITLQDEADVALSNNTLRQKGFFAKHQFRDIIHTSADMDKAIDIARQIALTNHTVLIRGESGTGKELMAQSIHNASYRNKFPFVAVNCAALPDNLLESELFGYEAGAFTGAHTKGKVGLFEQANHGTIFLDEIGDISPKLQSRLLRTIQEHQIMRVGSDRMIEIDVRFITATNRNLEQAVREGTFRSDLFFRLNVLPVVIPPLRKRKDDILVLLQYFLGGDFKNITAQDLTLLSKYDWPGNIRELENVATYYKTLLSLPEYITEQRFTDAAFTTEVDIQETVLKLIYSNTALSHGIGRSNLLQQLEQKGISISDGKLRNILDQMQTAGLIEIGKGRYGTRITEKGKFHLNTPPTNNL
ncbi:MAG: sigma-54 interaction domain-containing protein [Emergencia timonensis]|uniref:sigma-54 interaction domain-containing protein n=1 Tax=Emergencia timonensis TaxID=1776384 RepID=UPI0008373DBF|nr:sigma 54-interacting transcriptional regulator [Emergencia timonensis]WNX88645.1 sigma 54-interacting transcriptional regulator [Emergencia timonensis]